tara:strand:- start:75 stop:902 length:828 start_codon:yes stop_codon:yes gene_type:complete
VTCNTKQIFIVGSGRCGTRSLFKILNKIENVKAYHEYLCEIVQKEACKKMMGLRTKKESIKFIEDFFKTAINYEDKNFWIDCSNKLSWFIPELKEVFPECKFVLLLRDGRKVSSSFFNKLKPEIYNDNAVNILEKWMEDKKNVEPPTEKPYWWILPKYYNLFSDNNNYNQFQKICWHWKSVNRYVLNNFNKIDKSSYHIVKLEKLVNSKIVQKKLFDFMGLKFKDIYSKMLSRPENVFIPYDFKLNDEQNFQFSKICNELMLELDYKGEEYNVRY